MSSPSQLERSHLAGCGFVPEPSGLSWTRAAGGWFATIVFKPNEGQQWAVDLRSKSISGHLGCDTVADAVATALVMSALRP